MENEIVLYQPNELTKLEVHINQETVWLTQQQIAELFGVKQPAISKHLNNIFKEGELDKNSVHSILEYTASDGKTYKTQFYNLDAILSVGYRVNSHNATLFRQWANKILKDYMLRGYALNQRLLHIENELAEHKTVLQEHDKKIDFFVRTSLPPMEGVFYDGQIFDAYVFVSDLVKSATKSIVLIDNYIDETIFTLLDKRAQGVQATIYTPSIGKITQLDIDKHDAQYCSIEVKQTKNIHDRFLIVDEVVYHIGASIKDLGKKLFAFSKMEMGKESILEMV